MTPELTRFKEMVAGLPPEGTGLKTKIVLDLIRHIEFLDAEVEHQKKMAREWERIAQETLGKALDARKEWLEEDVKIDTVPLISEGIGRPKTSK